MATEVLSSPRETSLKREWLPGHPWAWMGPGLLACAAAWVWVDLFGEAMPALRYGLVVGGLLAVAAALVIRTGSLQPAFLDRLAAPRRQLILLILAGLFAMMAAGITLLVVLSFLRLAPGGYRWGPLIVWWFIAAPMSGTAAALCWRKMRQNQPVAVAEESAALLLLGALACYFCQNALYLAGAPEFLDSMRLFLGVLTLAALLGAALVVVPLNVRRGVLSLLICVHFVGILATTLVVPPAPLVITQLWNRIYRPYLEFVYLTNAYHFYAPEPGPASYLWFRVIFEDDKGNVAGDWFKVPNLDDKYRSRHATGLSYQRHLALTEHTVATTSTPAFYDFQQNAITPAPFFNSRLRHIPQLAPKQNPLGVQDTKVDVAIPWHPDMLPAAQYKPPTDWVKKLLTSYSRHVLSVATLDGYTTRSVKVYRVVHLGPVGPSMVAYLNDVAEPTDPDTYYAIYYGEYDLSGQVIDGYDPFLYWVLPTIKEQPTSRDSRYRCYTRKHAGDPYWIRDQQRQWVEK